jgi:hypothetical protein
MPNKLQKKAAAFITKLIVASIAILTISNIILFVILDKSNINTAIAQPMISRAYPFGGHITHFFRFGTIGSIQMVRMVPRFCYTNEKFGAAYFEHH